MQNLPMFNLGFAHFKPGRLGFFILVFCFLAIFSLVYLTPLPLTFKPQPQLQPQLELTELKKIPLKYFITGTIDNINVKKKLLGLTSETDSKKYIVKLDSSTLITNLPPTFPNLEPGTTTFTFQPQITKIEDLKPKFRVSVLTVEIDPKLTQVTAKQITVLQTI